MSNICFSAGPAAQNQQVLAQLSELILQKPSLLEMSHRSDAFKKMYSLIKKECRTFFNVPEDMEILFLSGGASFQFQMIPCNLLHKKAGYLITGLFSKLAYEVGGRFGQCDVLYDNTDHSYDFNGFPQEVSGDYDYVHICLNNSIYGTRTPDFKCHCPVIADVSSILGIEKIDLTRYAMCYASAQKNFGISGMTLVFIRKNLIFNNNLNPLVSYDAQIKADSLINTPPVLAIVMCGLIVRELLKRKESVYEDNKRKAELFYEFLDQQDQYQPLVQSHRSIMNCTFQMKSSELEQYFLNECEKELILGLKGHRSAGHLRVSFSVHNTLEDVSTLIQWMKKHVEL